MLELKLDEQSLKQSYQQSASLLARHLIHVMYAAAQKHDTVDLSSEKLLQYLADITEGSLNTIPKTERVTLCAIFVGYANAFYNQTYNYVKGNEIDLDDFNIEFNSRDLFDFIKTVSNVFNDRVHFTSVLNRLSDVGILNLGNGISHIQSLGRTKVFALSTDYIQKFYSVYYENKIL
jgi:hypothetical protein